MVMSAKGAGLSSLAGIPLKVNFKPAYKRMQQRAAAQPVKQPVAVGRIQHHLQGVAAFADEVALGFAGQAQQINIVIAQHGDGGFAQIADKAQRAERFRATVNQIADKPEAVAGGVEFHLVEQCKQLVVTALNVTNRVPCHAARPVSCRKPPAQWRAV